MTRGKIVGFFGDKAVVSCEFNGDMYYDYFGKEVIEGLRKSRTESRLRDFIESFDAENFGYKKEYGEELVFEHENTAKLWRLDKDYFDKWFSDYLYIKNFSDTPLEITTKESGKIVLKKGDIVSVNFGAEVDRLVRHHGRLGMSQKSLRG